jgi:hypothetical protein
VRKEGSNDDGEGERYSALGRDGTREGERYSALGRDGTREGTVDIIAVASWDLEAEGI